MSKTYGQIVEQVCKLYQRYGIKSLTMAMWRGTCAFQKRLYTSTFPTRKRWYGR